MNISRHNLTAADGSFLGYLFQIEKVLQWLSELPESASVGVEVTDDIVVRLNEEKGINEIYEQAKHTQGKLAPFTDKSEDLWKTLSIWIKAVVAGKVNPEVSKFSFLSNKPIPSYRLAYKLHQVSFENEADLEKCCEELVLQSTKLRKGLHEYGLVVQQCPINVLKKIVAGITILDVNYEHNKRNFQNKLKSNLHLSDDLPIDDITEKLFGFVSMYLIQCWREKKEAWMAVAVFNRQFTQLIAEYKKKSFFEKAIDLLPVSANEVKKNRGKTYVEQLRLIECDEDEILGSIHDYLRALSERDRFARDGEISSEKFDQYFDDLTQNWKGISKPRFRFCNESEYIKTGYEVFYETLKYRGKINNCEPEQHYTYRGAYHYLANEMTIGWHPKWQDKFSK